MGALCIRDEEARRLTERRGLTKIAAVELALVNELGKDEPRRNDCVRCFA